MIDFMQKRVARLLPAVAILLIPANLHAQLRSSDQKFVSPAPAGSSATAPCALLEDSARGGRALGGGTAAAASSVGFDVANLDRSANPCENFFQFADGGWVKNNAIPADRGRWASFDRLGQRNQEKLRTILEEAAKDTNKKAGSNWQKIGDFYASCMDEPAIDAAGTKPLQPELDRIAAIRDAASLEAEMARLQYEGVGAGFEFGSETDLKDSNKVVAGAGQGGLGLPDRRYYLDDDDRSRQLRAGYVKHVTNMFKLMGDSDADAAAGAQVVMDIEMALAKASTKREDLRDPESNYHPMTLQQLESFTPDFSWPAYLKEVKAPPISSIDIGQLDFFKQFDASLKSVALADWKTYLRWHLIHSAAPALPAKFVDENFDFYGRQLTGTPQNLPRWQRCVQRTDQELGEALGQYYVEKYFPPEAKAKALAMVKNLIAALHDDLTTLDWMSPATRQAAIQKLDLITLKIGYPDKWRDYSNFHVERVAFLEDVFRGNQFESAFDMAKIGKPVDKGEWGMTPPTVNAYYRPSRNEIVFPAGILQPPFYDPKADDAINYGGIGAVIGHEMTHGFDDQGAKFDGYGNLRDWWTPEDLKNFQARGECIANQLSSYEVEPGLNENGKLEEGESIADLGGLTIAHAAFEKSLQGKPAPAPIDGFTAEQRFFLGFAQIWASSMRPEMARLRAKTDPHPLDMFRVKAAIANTPSFATAWGCSADSPMLKPAATRCRIW
jgi:putative endopeptidase